MSNTKYQRIVSEWNSSNKYVKDLKLEDKDGIVEISADNAARVFALVRCNPKYSKCYDSGIKDSSANLLCYGFDFNEKKLYEILKALNADNATHVKDDDVKAIAHNISTMGRIKFEKALNEPSDYEIIAGLYRNVPSGKALLSFSSKVCHFYCWHVLKDESVENFPMVDRFMKGFLPLYYNGDKKNDFVDEMRKENKDFNYKLYVETLKQVSCNRISVTATEQLIWYYHNGMKIPSKKEIKDQISKKT